MRCAVYAGLLDPGYQPHVPARSRSPPALPPPVGRIKAERIDTLMSRLVGTSARRRTLSVHLPTRAALPGETRCYTCMNAIVAIQ